MGNSSLCRRSEAEQGEIEFDSANKTNYLDSKITLNGNQNGLNRKEPSPDIAVKLEGVKIDSLISQEIKAIIEERGYNNEILRECKSRLYNQPYCYRYNKTSEVYCGDFDAQGNKNNVGLQVWPDGSYYEGQFKVGKIEGFGRLVNSNLEIYEGDWKNNIAFGEGISIDKTKVRFEGNFENNEPNGFGVEKWPDGTTYTGNFVNGKKNGRGVFKWADGAIYEGEFIDDEFNGQGTYTWPDGRSYTGEFKNNKMDGYGEFKWPNGQIFMGMYKNDMKNGPGEFHWANNYIFKGNYVDGRKEGEGIITSPEGQERKGIWEQDKLIKWID